MMMWIFDVSAYIEEYLLHIVLFCLICHDKSILQSCREFSKSFPDTALFTPTLFGCDYLITVKQEPKIDCDMDMIRIP